MPPNAESLGCSAGSAYPSPVEASITNQPPKIPTTVLHNDYKPYRDSLVLIWLGDFAAMVQKLKNVESRGGIDELEDRR